MGTPKRAAANDQPPLSAVQSDDDDHDEPQADDPVSRLVAGLPGLDDLGAADPFGGQVEDDDPDVVPAGFDAMRIHDDVVARVRSAGQDPRVVRIGIHPVIRGKRRTAQKRVRPEGVTYARLQEALAPGTYDLMAHNDRGTLMGCKRIHVQRGGDFDSLDDLDELEDLGGGGRRSRSRGSMGDRLLYELAMRGMRGGESQGRSNEMSSALSDFAKLITLQATAASTQTQTQLKAMELESKRLRSESSGQVSMLRTVMDLVDRRTPKGRSGGPTKVEDVLGLLQVGMSFQKAMSGAPETDDAEQLRRWVLPLVDSLGPQLIGLIAMALPKDKAALVTELLEQHLRTQEARASGADPDAIDVPGEDVGNTEG